MEVVLEVMCLMPMLFMGTTLIVSGACGLLQKRPRVQRAAWEAIGLPTVMSSYLIFSLLRANAHIPGTTMPAVWQVVAVLSVVGSTAASIMNRHGYIAYGITSADTLRAMRHAVEQLRLTHEWQGPTLILPSEGIVVRSTGPIAGRVRINATGKGAERRLRQLALRMAEYVEEAPVRAHGAIFVTQTLGGLVYLLMASGGAVVIAQPR